MQISYNPSIRMKILIDLLMIGGILLFTRSLSILPDVIFFTSPNLVIMLTCLGCWFGSGRWMRLYKDFRVTKFAFDWIVFLKALILYSLLITFVFFQFLKDYPLPRTHLAIHCGLLFLLL